MKKAVALILCLAVWCAVATGAADSFSSMGKQVAGTVYFPDLVYWLDSSPNLLRQGYVLKDVGTFDAYTWDYPAGWKAEYDVFLPKSAQIFGWVWSYAQVDGQDAYKLQSGSLTAYIVPQMYGKALALLPEGCKVVEVEALLAEVSANASPTRTAAPVPVPAVTEAPAEEVWDWVEVETDCIACVGGTCDLCNGSGVYRAYGVAVDCPRECTVCDGKGTYTQRKYVRVQ